MPIDQALTPRWTNFHIKHPVQQRRVHSKARFTVSACGRRSGKTELEKRLGVIDAITQCERDDYLSLFAAPIHQQAKDLFWEDLKALTPSRFIRHISESERFIETLNGSRMKVIGLDKPQRAEGVPIDRIAIDEFADCKPDVWERHIRPALATPGRPGKASFFGVPEGRNHFWDIAKTAMKNETGEWEYFHWISADILDPAEIISAKASMDKLSYLQEFEAEFLTFEGRVYLPFDNTIHAAQRLHYNPQLDLIFCFDFNRKPGVCAIVQDYRLVNETWIIDEVWIPQNSNTERVCKVLSERYKNHLGRIWCYGDPTGGAKGSAKLEGSDWDIIQDRLGRAFPGRIVMQVRDGSPAVKVRINATNARLMTADDVIHVRVCPYKCPHMIEDFEGVVWLEGTNEIDKDADKMLTHISDAFGYFCEKKYSITPSVTGVVQLSQ